MRQHLLWMRDYALPPLGLDSMFSSDTLNPKALSLQSSPNTFPRAPMTKTKEKMGNASRNSQRTVFWIQRVLLVTHSLEPPNHQCLFPQKPAPEPRGTSHCPKTILSNFTLA